MYKTRKKNYNIILAFLRISYNKEERHYLKKKVILRNAKQQTMSFTVSLGI
jgi:hypothetical protein